MDAGLQPVAVQDRIQSLDVVRGFALLGIALMNVEFFNRPLAALGDGLPLGLHGPDQWAAMSVHLLVRAKFFTMFSILFGMGFALMLARAQAAGRPFIGTYLRRTVALALFGLVHGALIWAGDILLSYAAAAALLLVVLLGRGWMLWLTFALIIALGFAMNATGDAVYTGVILLIDAMVLTSLRHESWKGLPSLHGPRLLQAGLTLYLVPALLMVLAGGAMWRAEVTRAAATTELSAEVAKEQADGARMLAEYRQQHAQKIAQETRAMTQSSYAEAVLFRAPFFFKDFIGSLFFISAAMGLFMLGAWLLHSGVMVAPLHHLHLLHTLVRIVLPLGFAVTLASAWVATDAGAGQGRWLLATGLMFAGGMPMSLGYIALVLLALQRQPWRCWLAWLAPAGRMALSNYIGQSVICSLFFFGYGLGFWGMPRAQQVVFVLLMFVLQVLFSRWWLMRFRFGPLEWGWRWMTYGARPPLRQPAST